jgi:hypothetical protein
MKVLNRIAAVGMVRPLARSTIACYQSWVAEFLRYSRRDRQWRHPAELRKRSRITWAACCG